MQCATQAAIEGLASCLRHELKPRNVGVSIICASEFAAGNAWLDDKEMREQAREMWALLSEEQKEAYGEDYFEQAIRSLEPFCRGVSNECDTLWYAEQLATYLSLSLSPLGG